jgi:hypothetical protein
MAPFYPEAEDARIEGFGGGFGAMGDPSTGPSASGVYRACRSGSQVEYSRAEKGGHIGPGARNI